MRLLLCLLRILFLAWVTSIEHYWVTLRERRGALSDINISREKSSCAWMLEGTVAGVHLNGALQEVLTHLPQCAALNWL